MFYLNQAHQATELMEGSGLRTVRAFNTFKSAQTQKQWN